jgi:hypothetical protein
MEVIPLNIKMDMGHERIVSFDYKMLVSYGLSKSKSARYASTPWFTHSVKYPANILRRMTYAERVQFFFDRKIFEKILASENRKLLSEKQNNKVIKNESENAKTNAEIERMLELIDPDGGRPETIMIYKIIRKMLQKGKTKAELAEEICRTTVEHPLIKEAIGALYEDFLKAEESKKKEADYVDLKDGVFVDAIQNIETKADVFQAICSELKDTTTLRQTPESYQTSIVHGIASLKQYFSRIKDLNKSLKESNKTHFDQGIIDSNILMTLDALMPTTYPGRHNISSSFKSVIQKKRDIGFSIEPVDSIDTYMLDGSTKRTISKVIWLNDIKNHPVYFELIEHFSNFLKWTKTVKVSLETDLQLKKEILFNRLRGSRLSGKNGIQLDESDITSMLSTIKDRTDSYGRSRQDEKNDNVIELVNLISLLNAVLKYSRKFGQMSAQNPITINSGDNFKQYKLESKSSQWNSFVWAEGIPLYKTIFKSTSDVFELIQQIGLVFDQMTKQSSSYSSVFSGTVSAKIREMISESAKVKILQTIQDKYISQGNITLNTKDEDPNVINELKSKYPQYNDFVSKFQTFLPPRRESSNVQLQQLLHNYSQNTEDSNVTLSAVLEFIKEKYIEDIKPEHSIDVDPYMYTGVSFVGDKKSDSSQHTSIAEIYVMVDTTDEINGTNRSAVGCLYKNELLGTWLDNMLNANNKFDIKRVEFSEKKAKAEIEESKKHNLLKGDVAKQQKMPMSEGGKKTKHNRKISCKSRLGTRKNITPLI